MSRRRPSLMKFMEDQKLLQRESRIPPEEARKQIENSVLLQNIEHTAMTINEAAGSLLIEVQSYLWPDPLIRSFTVEKGDDEYVMQLESWSGDPILTFLLRKTRQTLLSRCFRWILASWAGSQDIDVSVKSTALVNPERATPKDIEDWFVYLPSGFNRSHTPTLPGSGGDDRESKTAVGDLEPRDRVIADECS